MKSKRRLSIWFFILVFIPIVLQAQTQRLVDLRDQRTPSDPTIPIQLAIDEIRQGVQFQRVENVARVLSKDFREEGKISDKDGANPFLQALFLAAVGRNIEVSGNQTTLWDFDIDSVNIAISNEGTATVSCVLLFHTLVGDSAAADLARTEEELHFKKSGEIWQLWKSRNLFHFLAGIFPEIGGPNNSPAPEEKPLKPGKRLTKSGE